MVFGRVTALHKIQDQTRRGLNDKIPFAKTVLMALDLSRAFDTISHTHLLQGIMDTTIRNDIKRWILAYFRGRHTIRRAQKHKINLPQRKTRSFPSQCTIANTIQHTPEQIATTFGRYQRYFIR